MRSRIRKRIVPLALGLLGIAPLLKAADARDTESLSNQADGKSQWTGSVEQKLWGLMTIWFEAKFNFPYFDRIPDIDWDTKVQEYIPRVMKADAYGEETQPSRKFLDPQLLRRTAPTLFPAVDRQPVIPDASTFHTASGEI